MPALERDVQMTYCLDKKMLDAYIEAAAKNNEYDKRIEYLEHYISQQRQEHELAMISIQKELKQLRTELSLRSTVVLTPVGETTVVTGAKKSTRNLTVELMRQKDEIDDLRSRILRLEDENADLRSENADIRSRILHLKEKQQDITK